MGLDTICSRLGSIFQMISKGCTYIHLFDRRTSTGVSQSKAGRPVAGAECQPADCHRPDDRAHAVP